MLRLVDQRVDGVDLRTSSAAHFEQRTARAAAVARCNRFIRVQLEIEKQIFPVNGRKYDAVFNVVKDTAAAAKMQL
jgi:hypothetical protein